MANVRMTSADFLKRSEGVNLRDMTMDLFADPPVARSVEEVPAVPVTEADAPVAVEAPKRGRKKRIIESGQVALPGLKKPARSKANRGSAWEEQIDRMNVRYERDGIGSFQPIDNKWAYTNFHLWKRLPGELRAIQEVTYFNRGKPVTRIRYLMRMKTPFDRLGVLCGRAIAYDLKSFQGPSFQAGDNIQGKIHQLYNLHNFERCRGIAGYLILSERQQMAYWVSATVMMQVIKDKLKSLNIKWLEEHATFHVPVTAGGQCDYARIMFPGEF